MKLENKYYLEFVRRNESTSTVSEKFHIIFHFQNSLMYVIRTIMGYEFSKFIVRRQIQRTGDDETNLEVDVSTFFHFLVSQNVRERE